ncbi:MAG TPA: alkaline phosphatase family protein [Humisphaera sp.]|jgi:hypothetical protein|nr:alkaline phosphatase family protein [Humisphaera sp.]
MEQLEGRRMLSVGPQPLPRAADAVPLPRYDHVVIVVEENHSYDQILGTPADPPLGFSSLLWPYLLNQPLPQLHDDYIRSLAAAGASFTNSHALTHPSQPNYLDLFSGSDQGVTSDATPRQTFAGPDLGGELLAAGLSFAGFSESLPRVGWNGGDRKYYVRHHSPWVNFSDVPLSDNLPFAKFPRDYTQLPTVSFVIPNLIHDMHSDTIQMGDRWVKKHMNRYARWARKHNSLLIVTWDESAGSAGRTNQIPTIFYGAHIQRGQYSQQINHFNVLRTIEDMYSLAPTGAAASATPISGVFGG